MSVLAEPEFRIDEDDFAIVTSPGMESEGKPGNTFGGLETMSLKTSSREGMTNANELDVLLGKELEKESVTPTRTEIIIRATRTQNVLGEKARRIRELTSVVQKRFNFPEGSVELYAEKVANRGLCAIAQCESLRYKLLGGLAVRRACYGVLRFIMESGAKGCEVVVSGKLRAQRAKSMKFVDGLMIHSGNPMRDYVDIAVRHVLLRQGVLGIKVKIMLPWDPTGKQGPKKPLPDMVTIMEPKEEVPPTEPRSESKVYAEPKPVNMPPQHHQHAAHA